MKAAFEQLVRWLAGHDERGASMIEYAMVIMLIVVVVIVLVDNIGQFATAGFTSTEAGFN